MQRLVGFAFMGAATGYISRYLGFPAEITLASAAFVFGFFLTFEGIIKDVLRKDK